MGQVAARVAVACLLEIHQNGPATRLDEEVAGMGVEGHQAAVGQAPSRMGRQAGLRSLQVPAGGRVEPGLLEMQGLRLDLGRPGLQRGHGVQPGGPRGRPGQKPPRIRGRIQRFSRTSARRFPCAPPLCR